ncbi:hypothetical protein [uncultured Litoreibacter sp.]|uniref:hypothetical protein n=1 Tax=uncultured Litoreibacter sp. TaxID=1392394 RepID=UPI0026021253|nr:hypothetical protein [uncultured Litoreibacter sp.]
MNQFSLYQDGIFRRLAEGSGGLDREEFFLEVIDQAAKAVASKCGFEIELHPTRIQEAQDLWIEDIQSLTLDKKIGGETVRACEYKQSSFLTYWLRRRLVVYSVSPKNPGDRDFDTLFKEYPSEYVALSIGLKLAAFHRFASAPNFHGDALAEISDKGDDMLFSLMHDALVLLHHKNVSPHALYLVFKALYTRMPPPSFLTTVR